MRLAVFLLLIAISVSNSTPLSSLLYETATDSSSAELKAESTGATAESEYYRRRTETREAEYLIEPPEFEEGIFDIFAWLFEFGQALGILMHHDDIVLE